MPNTVTGTCISSRSRLSSHINLSYLRIYFNPMAFRHKRLPSTRSLPKARSVARLFHFRPISSEYYPLFRVFSITMLPSRQYLPHTRATSTSQPPWRSFPSHLTDIFLLDTLTCLSWNSVIFSVYQLSKTFAMSICIHGGRVEPSLTKCHPFVVQSLDGFGCLFTN